MHSEGKEQVKGSHICGPAKERLQFYLPAGCQAHTHTENCPSRKKTGHRVPAAQLIFTGLEREARTVKGAEFLQQRQV